MSRNQGVVVEKPGEAQVQELSVPKLRDDYILVKVKAVALNPTDWKHVDYITTKGARVSFYFTLQHNMRCLYTLLAANTTRLVAIMQELSKK